MNEQSFSRTRKLPFPVMILFLTNLVRKTQQIELDRFFERLNLCKTVTKQAFSKARKHLSPTAFIELSALLITEFYSDNEYQLWKGFRLIGVDGSTLQLPNSKEILQKFGAHTNQHGSMAMARISCAYDLLNDLSVDKRITRYHHNRESKASGKSIGEQALALQHIHQILEFDKTIQGRCFHQNDLFLFDMGYPALDLIAYLQWLGKAFVFRCSDSFLKEVRCAITAGIKDQIIHIPLKTKTRSFPKKLKEWGVEFTEETILTLRVLLIPLPSGETEVLLTSLTQQDHFPYEDFPSLYEKRWGSETHYSTLKEALEIENFTGLSALSIKQDFFATVFTNNLRGLIQQEVQQDVEQDNQTKDRKHQYKVNTNLAIGQLKDELVKILVLEQDITPFYETLKAKIKRNIVPIRKNRNFPRNKKKTAKKFHMTKKRAL